MSQNLRSRLLDGLSVVSRRCMAGRRRVPEATAPERIAASGRMRERPGGDRMPLTDDLADAELALLVRHVRHLRRTVEFGARQAVRLREGRV
ncbi:hypothetical protein PYK79_30315 [Streptomyces sp. ID05-04B]|uniref:hypothetical protein n=1 Tax=Streptomyces sp. ID05-04B TaxID=3028661 RepID=UPI0029C2429B|nr:hypothetical protein [Streptomyces sp. ID05-04B]MDX5566697.1 hypothetical protein [Streptomyces sp. ID05-04B]